MHSTDTALSAIPNLVDSELADIYLLPSMTRLHSAFNRPKTTTALARSNSEVADTNLKLKAGRSGLVMSLHIAFDSIQRLCAVLGYEDGRVEMWRINNREEWGKKSDSRLNEDARIWNKVYDAKGHNEAGKSPTPRAMYPLMCNSHGDGG